jgi:aldose 1-epimerase
MKITSQRFGLTAEGDEVQIFCLTNNQGMEIKIINYGGIIVAINVPDRDGKVGDVVLGHETLEGYLNRTRYLGALIGRYANRIARGKFILDGSEYSLTINNGRNHLHGGLRGFDKVVWQPSQLSDGLQLTYLSRNGEEGYPGDLTATVTYVLSEANELRIEYLATTDKATVVNLTNHSYFNLAGADTILDHELTINADGFVAVDKDLIPTGEIRSVKDTSLDFTVATTIGARIFDGYEQLLPAGGYDHNFVLRTRTGQFKKAATLYEPNTGRVLEVSTTQPGMQFYSGNFLDGGIIGKRGRAYIKHSGCCFEPQHFPDSPHHPNFPTTVLRPGEEYRHTTLFKFSVD